jgi:hypothetical protein
MGRRILSSLAAVALTLVVASPTQAADDALVTGDDAPGS